MNKQYLPWMLIAIGLVVAYFTASWPALSFKDVKLDEFGSRFAALFLFALLIERTVEVLLTMWRAEDANKKQAEVQRLLKDGRSPTDGALVTAQNELIEYRAVTLRWALPISFFLGILLASLGVRVVSQFIDTTVTTPAEAQLYWFHLGDIVLSGALLAGGADPIHKVMDAFRKFMESSSAKSSGTIK